MAQAANILPFPNPNKKLAFTPMHVKFPDNQRWASNNLPIIRVALKLASFDRAQIDESLSTMLSADGVLPDLLDSLTRTKDHLQGIVELMECALTRSFVALEGLGYSPENPPK